ncbi:MAG: fatty acid desaturase family protein [Gemmatimonadales bacterium]
MTAPLLVYGCSGPLRVPGLDRADLPAELRARIRALQRLEPWRNLRLAAFLALWTGGGWLALTPASVLAHLGACFAIACALMGLSVFMHEGAHGLLFRSRWLSRLGGLICGLPVGISVSAYRAMHLRHHAYERTARDPDDIEAAAPKSVPLVLVYYALLLLGTYLYFPHVALRGYLAARGRERVAILAEYLAIVGAHAAAWWLLSPGEMVRLWLLPMLVAAQFTNVRSLAEHGLTTAGNAFTATRSVISNPVVRFVLCNLNFHLEHHLFPAVPWYHLPRLHRMLRPYYRPAGSSVYRSYGEFMLDFFRTSWAGIIPNVRLIPAHLREDLCG